jgi:hypothetical protein
MQFLGSLDISDMFELIESSKALVYIVGSDSLSTWKGRTIPISHPYICLNQPTRKRIVVW